MQSNTTEIICSSLAGTANSRLHESARILKISKVVLRKGQSSMEYLLLMGFVFFLLVAIMFVAYSQSTSLNNDVTAAQIQKVGNQIADAVNIAYYAGPPTKKTISVYFPDDVDAVTVANQSIVFRIQSQAGKADYAIATASNVTGTLQHFAGLHTITITALSTVVNISDG